mgnify:FL=1|tara:strand:- start:484 stop:909 length:426 start_codon:yes stop_codon:yes gene_type:complete
MAAIDLNTVRAAIEGRVATELASSPVISVVFNNMPFEPTIGTSFVQCLVNFAANTYESQTISSSTVNSVTGVLTLNIYSKAGIGSGANLTIAKRLRDLFNREKVSDIYFEPPNGPTLLQSTEPEGYFQSVINVDFEIFENL